MKNMTSSSPENEYPETKTLLLQGPIKIHFWRRLLAGFVVSVLEASTQKGVGWPTDKQLGLDGINELLEECQKLLNTHVILNVDENTTFVTEVGKGKGRNHANHAGGSSYHGGSCYRAEQSYHVGESFDAEKYLESSKIVELGLRSKVDSVLHLSRVCQEEETKGVKNVGKGTSQAEQKELPEEKRAMRRIANAIEKRGLEVMKIFDGVLDFLLGEEE